jgi:hypothetical protein
VYICTEQLPPGGYPIAVKYIMYHYYVTNISIVFRSLPGLADDAALMLPEEKL